MKEKRQLPRHVDGRIMIGMIPFKSFLFLLPVWGIELLIFYLFSVNIMFNPLILMIGGGIVGFTTMLFCEINHETGYSLIKDSIKNFREGDKYTERGGKK